jgi:hypothetical protein
MEKVLVLNSDFTPINVTSVIKGFNLVNKGKAEVLKASDKPIIAGDKLFDRPLIIRLFNYVRYRFRSLKINRHRIFKRDKYECAYCGISKNLSIDHIIPKSRGGQNTWDNLVTCCKNCNRIKDNKTPEEAGMRLLKKPFEPTLFSHVINPDINEIWENFKVSYS